MTRFSPRVALATLLLLLTGCGGSASSSTSWYAHWWCTVAQCAVVMGGSSGVAGPFAQQQECETWRQTYILTSVCNTSASGGGTPAPPPAPTITSFTPASGLSSGSVTVTGTNFTADLVVTFAGVQLTPMNVTATQFSFFLPPMGSFSGPISVTTAGGTVTSSTNFQVVNDLQGVAWTGSNFVVVGMGNDILTSADGAAWTARAANLPYGPSYPYLYGVAAMGSRVVAVGYGGRTTVSTDHGLTWSGTVTSSMAQLFAVTSTGAQFVAVGSFDIQTSPDGISWTAVRPPYILPRHDVAWSGSLLVATGSGGAHTLATSADGVAWSEPPSAASFTVGMEGVASSGSLWVAVGPSATATSPDGIAWTSHPAIAAGVSLTWFATGSRFVAVGPAGAIQTSPDGLAWTTRSSGTPRDLSRVACSPAMCVAVGTFGTIVTSPDGATWTKRATP